MFSLLDYKDIPVYVIDVPYGAGEIHREFFTSMPWGDFKRITFSKEFGSLTEREMEDEIFLNYTLRKVKYSRDDLAQMPAGIITTVAQAIASLSRGEILPDSSGKIDVVAFENRLNVHRMQSMSSLEQQMYTIICSVFKAYTFEALNKLPYQQLLGLFANAEHHLLTINAIKEPLSFYVKEIDLADSENKRKPERPAPVARNVEPVKSDEDLVMQMAKAAQETKKINRVVDYVAPTQSEVEIPAGKGRNFKMAVPGVNLNDGFRSSDFEGKAMTDEEAEEIAMSGGLIPAGYDILLKRRQMARAQAEEQKKEEVKSKYGNKKLTLREQKALRQELGK